jgi:hypothetical protein
VLTRVDKNNTAALNTVFLSLKGLSTKKNNKYQLPPSFFDSVNLGGGCDYLS